MSAFKDRWLEGYAVVPVDMGTTTALMAEVKRLRAEAPYAEGLLRAADYAYHLLRDYNSGFDVSRLVFKAINLLEAAIKNPSPAGRPSLKPSDAAPSGATEDLGPVGLGPDSVVSGNLATTELVHEIRTGAAPCNEQCEPSGCADCPLDQPNRPLSVNRLPNIREWCRGSPESIVIRFVGDLTNERMA